VGLWGGRREKKCALLAFFVLLMVIFVTAGRKCQDLSGWRAYSTSFAQELRDSLPLSALMRSAGAKYEPREVSTLGGVM